MICIEFYSYIQCGIIFNFPFETPLTGSFRYKKFRGQRRRNAHILEPCQCFSLVLILESFACQNLHLLINFNESFYFLDKIFSLRPILSFNAWDDHRRKLTISRIFYCHIFLTNFVILAPQTLIA